MIVQYFIKVFFLYKIFIFYDLIVTRIFFKTFFFYDTFEGFLSLLLSFLLFYYSVEHQSLLLLSSRTKGRKRISFDFHRHKFQFYVSFAIFIIFIHAGEENFLWASSREKYEPQFIRILCCYLLTTWRQMRLFFMNL